MRSPWQYRSIKLSVLLSALALVLVVGCGSESEQGLPQATPPIDNGNQNLPPTDRGGDARLPDLTHTSAINLADSTSYSGLNDLGFTVVLPTVGDTLMRLALTQTTGQPAEGSFFIGFEDANAFRWATLQSFPKTGVLSATFADMIFQDDLVVIRIIAGLTSSYGASGTIYYRKRVLSEEPCMKKTNPPSETLLADQCRLFMGLGNPEVKSLGTFTYSGYANWID